MNALIQHFIKSIVSPVKLLTIVSLVIILPSSVGGQRNQTLPIDATNAGSSCVSPLSINNPALLKELARFFAYIEGHELPILALDRNQDSSFCYVSALMSTYAIRHNPPTAIVKVLNREALLYTGTESVAQVSTDCKQYLIRKYLNLLHVDRVNKKEGAPIGSSGGFIYDPILVKISLKGTKVVGVTNPDSFPHFTY